MPTGWKHACTQAAIKMKKVKFQGWCRFEAEDWLNKSLFSLKQDTRMLGSNIVQLGGQFLKDIIAAKKPGYQYGGLFFATSFL